MPGTIPQTDQIYQFPIGLHDLNLNREQVLRAMGYRDNIVPPVVLEEIDAVLSGDFSLPGICGGYKVLFSAPLQNTSTGFQLAGTKFMTGATIAVNLQECEYAALFAATAGDFIGERMQELTSAGEILLAYTWDCIGSEIAEAACDYLQANLEAAMRVVGLNSTSRYSPGYCGWDVREQHKLFALLPAGFCGISLTSSALMLPVKSVSGVIGIGRQAVKRNYGCALCTLENCYKRK